MYPQNPTAVAVSSICGPPKHTSSQELTKDHTSSLTHLKQESIGGASHSSSPSIPHTPHQTTYPPSSPLTKAPTPSRSSTHAYINPSATPPAHPVNPRKRRVSESAESKEMAKKRLELQKKTGELLQAQINQQKVGRGCGYGVC